MIVYEELNHLTLKLQLYESEHQTEQIMYQDVGCTMHPVTLQSVKL
jgi:hypothetical protein